MSHQDSGSDLTCCKRSWTCLAIPSPPMQKGIERFQTVPFRHEVTSWPAGLDRGECPLHNDAYIIRYIGA